MYLVQNGVLCKEYEDHVKKVSQDLKQASLEPFANAACRWSTSPIPKRTRRR
jgi:hypothetical protein